MAKSNAYLIEYICDKCEEAMYVPSATGEKPSGIVLLTHYKTQEHVGTFKCGLYEKGRTFVAVESADKALGVLEQIKVLVS